MSRAARLKVMAFNIHGGRPRVGPPDLRSTAAAIAREGPDLVALQEVNRYLPRRHAFHDAPARLRRMLGMEARFVPAFGIGRTGYGNAVLSRVPLGRARRVPLPAPALAEPRVLQEVSLDVGGQPVHLLNVHVSHHARQRRAQVIALAARVRRLTRPIIVAGDLNAAPHSEELALLRQAGLLDHCSEDMMTFPCHAPACRLDYILVSHHFEVRDCRVVDTDASDHLPLVAELALR